MQVIITLSIILVLIGEGHATFMRNFTWKNEESLWIDCIEKYPQLFRAHHNLGRYYADNNEEEKAIKEYQEAIQLESIHNTIEKSVTFANLGTIFFLKEELEKAKNYYLEAIRIDPCSRGAHNNLGALLAITTDDYRGVFNELKKEIDCDEYSAHAHSNMGILLIKMGRLGEGIATLEGALEIDPYNIGTLERLGYAYIKKRRLGTASIYFKKALKQGHIRTLLYLAEIYIIGGHEQKAQNSLSQFLGLVEDRNLDSFLDELLGEESLLKTTPNMDIVLPRLCKAYKEKVKFLKKKRFLSEYVDKECLRYERKESEAKWGGYL
jgi:tetratricopeptide (TPR) repeat protein